MVRPNGYLMAFNTDTYVPVTGGVNLASRYVRGDVDDVCADASFSDIDRHLIQLMQLHPSVKVAFRNQDLKRLSDSDKLSFISDMNDVLGILPSRARLHR